MTIIFKILKDKEIVTVVKEKKHHVKRNKDRTAPTTTSPATVTHVFKLPNHKK